MTNTIKQDNIYSISYSYFGFIIKNINIISDGTHGNNIVSGKATTETPEGISFNRPHDEQKAIYYETCYGVLNNTSVILSTTV